MKTAAEWMGEEHPERLDPEWREVHDTIAAAQRDAYAQAIDDAIEGYRQMPDGGEVDFMLMDLKLRGPIDG